MATVARSLSRAAWSVARQTIPARQSTRCSCPIPQPPRRPFSVTPFLRSRQPDDIEAPAALADGSDDQNDEALELRRGGGDMEESDEFMDASILREIDQEVTSIERQMPLSFNAGKMKMGYWGEDEEDEFAQIEDDDDDYHEDAITSMAHAELEQHRELREYARIIAWDMPSLSGMDIAILIQVLLEYIHLRNN